MAIAKVPTVSNFFCYFELSTGGLVLGCFDAAVYGLVLLGLVINLITGMAIISSERLNKFSLLGLTIDAVVQLVLLVLFLGIALAFIKGVKDRSPKLCLPFVILLGIQAAVTLMEGLVFLSVFWLFVAGFKIYFFIVVYSLHKVFTYGDEQAAYEAHQNAASAGYEQYYEPEGYNTEGYNNIESHEQGYQTTEFKGA